MKKPERKQLTVIVNRGMLDGFNRVCRNKGITAAAEIRSRIYGFNDANAELEFEVISTKAPRPLHPVDDQTKLVINIDARERAIFKETLEADGHSISEVVRGWIEQLVQEPQNA